MCAVSNKLFQSVKGVVIPLSGISNIVKGKQINGDFLAEVGEYYVMNGGTEPSGYYDNYNVEANTISISEGGNSCGYVQQVEGGKKELGLRTLLGLLRVIIMAMLITMEILRLDC